LVVAEPTVKGVAFRTVLGLARRKKGDALVERALAAMPKDLEHALRYEELIPAGRYPIAWYRAMWSALLAATAQGDAFVREIGRDSVDNDFNLFYRALMKMLSPATLVTVGTRYFSQIYDTGTVTVSEKTPVSLRLAFAGCTGFNHVMWIEILACCERLGELAGVKNAQSTLVDGGGDDEAHCVAKLRWELG
jgi:hypothetical protein